MLESLRGIQNTAVGKAIVAVIMGLIMVSFVIWGIGPVFTGFNANQIAKVGDTGVTLDAFRQAYQNELQGMEQRTRQPITAAQAHQAGLDSQVLSRLVSEAVLDSQTVALGLSISDDQIAKSILADPSFKGPNGQFDRGLFNNILRDNGLNEQSFVRDQRAVYLRQEIVQGMVGAVTVPRAAIDALYRFDAETRSIDYVTLPASAAGSLPEPDQAALEKFFNARAPAYRAPERRKLTILPLLPATLAKPDEVSDADVEALYNQVKDQRFTTPEFRTLQQIVFPDEAEAAAAAARIKAGASFADIATERKLGDKDLDLGRVAKASLFDKAVADAAFALAEGGTSEPVKTAFGAAVVHAVKVEPATIRPLADVAPGLRRELAEGRTSATLRSLHDKIEDARSAGKTLAEAASAAGAETRTVDAVDATGKDAAGNPVDLPGGADLIKAAFASDVGVDNEAVRTREGGQVFFEVAAVEPARPLTFAEVRPQVEASWRQNETATRLADKGTELVKAVDGGQTVEQVAASLGLPLQHANDVRRAGGGGGMNPAVTAQVFNDHVGKAGAAAGEGDTRVVFKILGSAVPPLDPDTPQVKQLDTQYRRWLAEDMLGSYLTGIEGKIGVRINPEAYRNAIGGPS